jgi:hypothetical protein
MSRALSLCCLCLSIGSLGCSGEPAAAVDLGPDGAPLPDGVADAAPDPVNGDAGADAGPAPDVGPPPAVPAEGWVVWESTRVGGKSQVFLMQAHADGEQAALVTQLTSDGGREPRWSPDGQWISYVNATVDTTYLMRPDKSETKELFDGAALFWMHDGTGLVCGKGDDVFLVDPASGSAKLLFRRTDFAHFASNVMQPGGITADGRYMVVGTDLFRYGHTADNGSHKASFAAAIVDLTAKDKVYFFGYGCAPRTAPAGDVVYHVNGDNPTKPDIYRLRLADLASRSSYGPEVAQPDADWGHTYFPRISNDNRWVAYGASTGCHDQWSCDYEIFLHYLGADPQSRTRLTFHGANDREPDLRVGPLWRRP